MNINKALYTLSKQRANTNQHSASIQSKLSKTQEVSSDWIQQKMIYHQRRMMLVGARMVSIPEQYRFSGEGGTKKITKLELLKRINQYNDLNNYHSRSYEPIDFKDMSKPSWDLFSAEELLAMSNALQALAVEAPEHVLPT